LISNINESASVVPDPTSISREIDMTIDLQAKLEGTAITRANSYRPHHPRKQRASRGGYGKDKEKQKPERKRALLIAPPDPPVIPDFMREILARYTSTPF
jgi:hypothetical protein